MKLTRILIALLSTWSLVLLPMVICKVEYVKVGEDPKRNKTNPYITKFHETASMRPTKCHGKSKEFLLLLLFFFHFDPKYQRTKKRNTVFCEIIASCRRQRIWGSMYLFFVLMNFFKQEILVYTVFFLAGAYCIWFQTNRKKNSVKYA